MRLTGLRWPGLTDPHPLLQRDYFLSEVLAKHAVKQAFQEGLLVGFASHAQGQAWQELALI